MKILMVHSRYQQLGGEDISTRNEVELLRTAGHEVELIEFDNQEVAEIGAVRAGLRSIWSRPAMQQVGTCLANGGFEILHVQNYLPLVSPAVLRLGRRYGVASVQALRNYRLLCTNAKLFRQGRDCRDCVGDTVPLKGVMRGCYRDSLPASAAIAAMIGTHKLLGTWRDFTDAFIPVSEFVGQIYSEGGFDPARIHAKPNVVAEPLVVDGRRAENRVLYAGRLTREKGVQTVIEAWRAGAGEGVMEIAGDGPYEAELRRLAEGCPTIRFLGRLERADMLQRMATSRAVIIPSLWDEPFPRTGVEAFSVGAPVIGAASGGIPELFGLETDRDTSAGALFPPGDAGALRAVMSRFLTDDALVEAARRSARRRFEAVFSPAAILARTEEIYGFARARLAACDTATA